MTMFADPDSRGGILEPAGITEVKFRIQDQLKVMHRLDPILQLLDADLEATHFDNDASEIKRQITEREELLKPVYLQAATEFADLHDKTGRMKAKGVIEAAVPWARSREFFFNLATRRIAQDEIVARMKKADDSLDTKTSLEILKSLCTCDWEDNVAVFEFFESASATIDEKIASLAKSSIEKKIAELQKLL
jgi:acetyl-CoA carboxylase/biotin carboxylase 1